MSPLWTWVILGVVGFSISFAIGVVTHDVSYLFNCGAFVGMAVTGGAQIFLDWLSDDKTEGLPQP